MVRTAQSSQPKKPLTLNLLLTGFTILTQKSKLGEIIEQLRIIQELYKQYTFAPDVAGSAICHRSLSED